MILSDVIVPFHALLSVSHSTLQKNGHFPFRSRSLIRENSETCPVLKTTYWQKHLLGTPFYTQVPWGRRQYWLLRPDSSGPSQRCGAMWPGHPIPDRQQLGVLLLGPEHLIASVRSFWTQFPVDVVTSNSCEAACSSTWILEWLQRSQQSFWLKIDMQVNEKLLLMDVTEVLELLVTTA